MARDRTESEGASATPLALGRRDGPREHDATYTVTAEIWRWSGKAAWHFITLPEDVADEIHARFAHGAFGMVHVRATLGATSWQTKLFADTKRDSYLLPVKADVRRRERVGAGDTVSVRLGLDAD